MDNGRDHQGRRRPELLIIRQYILARQEADAVIVQQATLLAFVEALVIVALLCIPLCFF